MYSQATSPAVPTQPVIYLVLSFPFQTTAAALTGTQTWQAAPHCQGWEGSQLICLGYSGPQVRAGSPSLHLHTPVLVPRPCSAIPPQLTVSHCFLVVLVYVLFECLFHLLPRTALSLLFIIIPSLFILTTNNVRDGALIRSPVHHET